jgi:putative tryptophan/tyrosine transport system substrate-binding protein
MKRREFFAALGGVAAWPLVARGQGSPRVRRVIAQLGGASRESAAPQFNAIIEGLRDLGYRNEIDYEFREHWANGEMHRLPELAQAVVRLNPDAILAVPTPAAVAASAATKTIPIVCFMLADEVRLGLVASDARPGANVTGLAMRVDGMAGKQLELASELLVNTKRIGILVNVASSDTSAQLGDAIAAASRLNIKYAVAEVRVRDELDAALRRLIEEHVSSILVLYDALFFQERRRIASLVEATGIPTVYGARDHVTDGGLMSYGISLRASAYRSAWYFDQIFKGAKAGNLPVEFPTKLELVINLKTAKALGLNVPPTLLARADEVIE